MSFVPPRCPNRECPGHESPACFSYQRRGYYQPMCRTEPVPRFRCNTCERGFSRQTFRHDYYDRRPELNAPLLKLLTSGVGFRQCGRLLGVDMNSVQMKMRKIARTCRPLHDNLSPEIEGERTFLMDEEETYEAASIRPLTMPVLIERQAWFVVATGVGSIRRLAKKGTKRRLLQEHEDATVGRRPDESNKCVRAVFQQLRSRIGSRPLILQTDKKTSYAKLADAVFGDQVVHLTTSSKQIRNTRNPLFPINTTLAMTRDNCGRLRRRSWLVTKHRDALSAHLAVFTVYRNYIRRRFNRDAKSATPAWHLGLLPRELHPEEALAWRQDWGARSIHPMSDDGKRTVRTFHFAANNEGEETSVMVS